MSTDALRSSMNVHVFAEDIVGSNGQTRVLALELKILRVQTDGPKRKEMIIVADRRWSLYDHVRVEATALSDRHPIANATVRTNEYVGTDFRFRTHNGGWVNHTGEFRMADFGWRMCEHGTGNPQHPPSAIRHPPSDISVMAADLWTKAASPRPRDQPRHTPRLSSSTRLPCAESLRRQSAFGRQERSAG